MCAKTTSADYCYTGEEVASRYQTAKLECRVEELEAQIRGMREDHARLFTLAGRLMNVARAANAVPRNRVFATTRDLALYDALDMLRPGDCEELRYVELNALPAG